MLSVAPSGAQNRVARCEQPPSVSQTRMVTGSVALELAVANAVASASRMFHMNRYGLPPPSTAWNTGSTMNMWITSPPITTDMYSPSGPSSSTSPTLPTLALTRRNAPTGMIQSTQPTARRSASLMPLRTRTAGSPTSPESASATPSTIANMIIPSGWPSAMAANGFEGSICRAICSHAYVSPCPPSLAACVNFGAASKRSMPEDLSALTSSGESPSPGPTSVTSDAPSAAATSMVARKYALVAKPSRPSREGSPSDVMPATTLVKINGSTSIMSGRTSIRSPATENPDTTPMAPCRCSTSPTNMPRISAPIEPVATQRSFAPSVPGISGCPAPPASARSRWRPGSPCRLPRSPDGRPGPPRRPRRRHRGCS